jgi:hypothetical protein
MTFKALSKAGAEAQMAPVPRKLSSSCGTCVFYTSSQPHLELMGEEVEGVYEMAGDTYNRILSND